MAIQTLDTAGIDHTAMQFRDSIKTFNAYCERMETITVTLLDTWEGKGRDQFETQYQVLRQTLADINDELYDIYEELIDAGVAYGEADRQIAKEMRCE